MGLTDTPSAERVHIGFFGLRNAGKSSLVNKLTGQELSVVSDVKGTTTDPVRKTMELLPIGPVVIIDTPGLDDEGELGKKRIEKTKEILGLTDIAILVTDASSSFTSEEKELVELFKTRSLPYVIVYNKSDLVEGDIKPYADNSIVVSSKTGENIYELKELIGKLVTDSKEEKYLVSDLLSEGDMTVLVIPIDESAPKGRLILPQQLVMRDLLDHGLAFASCRTEELEATLNSFKKAPALVITDSQAFAEVSKIVPEDVALTSFSILMARYKGELTRLVEGANKLSELQDGSKVLISEGCTHHRQCNDIGTVKLPKLIRKYTGKDIELDFTSGRDFPSDLSSCDLVVHCGGCMLNDKEMQRRVKAAVDAGVPIVNYGVAIAKMNGILDRSLEPLKRSKSTTL
ncbi:MAG: [FeFe] hydrogenase H-cluster maturation GTPase HydF [Saccharofermentans sp.]|nr:[FeFe] hydrogenase H-cluster maturation GTPase HydF [Saccharofermentans sp.]